MNTKTFILTGMLTLLLGFSIVGRTDDVDIYSGLSGAAGKPNLLIILDNAANFSASGANCTYVDGTSPSLNGTVGGIEQCAIYNVIDGLPVNDDGSAVVNIGLMVYNANNIRDINNANCGGTIGGCLMVPLMEMTAANKTSFLAWVKTWKTSGGAGDGYIKANGEANGQAMQEAWAYYKGTTGLSGRNYSGVAPTAGCQKNFVVFIGNSFNSSGSPADGGSASPKNALIAAPGVTSAQTTIITKTYATACGGSFTFPSSNHESGGYYADEWARYMYQSDLYGDQTETQSIITYSIGVIDPSACQASYAALLNSMADVGGGKYFKATNYEELVVAMLKILNEVQAVNSVFASSSLPVSVNTQGTYLNQIFMGMFRPDGSGFPRWLGNLKQYQFILENNTLKLGDSLGTAAISSAGTGFIKPDAVSFWTCGGDPTNNAQHHRNCSPVADPTGGYWINNPLDNGAQNLTYDLDDGQWVEKGGAAQMLRLANLTNNYATSPSAPRKLYTYCPSGSSCNTALTNAANAFSTSNGDITAVMFGSATSLNVTSIVRTGTTALVTTQGNHGFTGTPSVTISGATQNEYNVTQNITVNSATTFTITGLPDAPPTPTAGTYVVTLHNAGAQTVSTITRSSSSTVTGSAANTETATATTAAAHGFTTTAPNNSVNITGAAPTDYNGVKIIATVPSTTTFTFPVTIYPVTPAANTYTAVIAPYSRTIGSCSKGGSTGTCTTSTVHGFHVGQSVTIAGAGGYDGTKTIETVPTTSSFTFGITGNPGTVTSGTVTPSTTPITLTGLTRTGTTISATATATGAPANAFANGDSVTLATAGTSPNESAYVGTFTISCSGTCTSFTYPVTTTPALSATQAVSDTPIQVALSTSPVTITAGNITRSGTTATATGITASTFANGNQVDISATGTVYSQESAYTGTWTISCSDPCTSFTYGPVTLTPTTPATGTISVYSGEAPPDKNSLINWVRGEDNYGDEKGPGGSITVRPSIHGDVLHSRPAVVNYFDGTNDNIVVYYGSNDGVFRAVNGNQTGTGAGGELWGFIPSEFFNRLTRQRTNSPQLKLPTTPPGILPTPQKKDYFADGPTSVYQLLNDDGTTNTAFIYLSTRRGGNFIYALDVTSPTAPVFKWKISQVDTDFAELGQTWSLPKVAKVKGWANPVLIFGGGYDTAQDDEPPGVDTSGRGIFIVDAITGVLVWKATYSGGTSACTGDATKTSCVVAGMNYGIPSDVTVIDRDRDNDIDRIYAVDVGGNVWRVDLEPTVTPAPVPPAVNYTPDHWKVTQIAALGCNTGSCASGTTQRKFFYPPDVVPANGYDAVLVGSGDREHPLYINDSYNVTDRFYMLKDTATGKDAGSPTVITENNLFDASTTLYPGGTDKGFYVTLLTGEKVVNAATTVAGFTFFGTNQPAVPGGNSCSTNLGIARSHRVNPFTGEDLSIVYSGGGLPPTPVAGVVQITVVHADGTETTELMPFVIGVGGVGQTDCIGDCLSAIGGGKPSIEVSTARKRTYWYIEKDE